MSAKEVGLRIRIEKELRSEFIALCRVQDRSAAQVLREFMRHYIENHQDVFGAQGSPLKYNHPANDGERRDV